MFSIGTKSLDLYLNIVIIVEVILKLTKKNILL